MKRANLYRIVGKALGAGLIAFVLSVTGCSQGGDDGEAVWLKDLKNPFIGTWESHIPSMDNAKMVSEFKTDGTFTCGFPDVPGFEGPFNGGYVVTGDIMASWLDYEGAAAYKFKVVDNDTINVTEFDDLEEGNTSAFTRAPGSTVNKEDKPLALNNVFIGGKWKSQIPSMDNAEMVSEFKADGSLICGFPDAPGFEGPFNGGYLVFEDKMVSWLDYEGAAAYKFAVNGDNTINVTEFDNLEEGNTSVFTRIQN
jgi:hypothetical protein